MKYAIFIERADDGNMWLMGPYDTVTDAEVTLSRLEIAGLSRNEVRRVQIIEQDQSNG
jgi:hypothetical protein